MPLFGLGLHVLAAVFFAIHAVRTRQELYWLLILFMFPLLGSLVYGVAVWLPEVRASRGVRVAGRRVRALLDPGRELREARAASEEAPSVRNQLRLADALLAAGQPAEALPYYDRALTGLFADDPDIVARKARALLEAGRAAQARTLLDELIARQPDYRSPEAHLVYARAVGELGERERAHEEFAVLMDSFRGLEARARYVALLRQWGETARAAQIATESLERARRLPAHTRDQEKPWIAMLENRLATR